MSSFPSRVAAVAASACAILLAACGGDAGTGPGSPGQPQPPAGSATQVPRVLGLSTVNGQAVPTMHYHSSTTSDTWTDSGSAAIQSDSVLVVRTYGQIVGRGATSEVNGIRFTYTASTRLAADGTALFRYQDGTVDTARVLASGAVDARLSIWDGGAAHPFGHFLFAGAHAGQMNPLPYLTNVQPASAVMGADSVVVTFTGSSFMPQTAALWNNVAPLKVTYIGPYQITVTLPGVLLKTAGTESLKLTNPAPGGGSVSYAFVVAIPEPAIMSVTPSTMAAAGGDFTLHVHGRGFTSGTRVLWNGAPRAAVVLGDSDLTTIIRSSEIPVAGAYQVAVQTLPPGNGLTGGGTSGVVTFTVTGTPAQKYAEVKVPFGASTLIADPTRPLVYGVASAYAPSYPNSVVALDPTTGQVVWTVGLGAQGGAAAISDDGAYLYVVTDKNSVDRIDLATHAVDLTIPLAGGSTYSYSGAPVVAVLPGQPHAIALARRCPCNDDPSTNYELEVLDDGRIRSQTASLPSSPAAMGFTSAQALYLVYPGSVNSYAVASTGVALQAQSTENVGSGALSLVGTRVYSTQGSVYDLLSHSNTQLSIAPTTAFPTSAVTPSSDAHLLYTIAPDGPFVRAYDVGSNTVSGAVTYTASQMMPGLGAVMIRWGTDGLAFSTGFDTWFIRASFVH